MRRTCKNTEKCCLQGAKDPESCRAPPLQVAPTSVAVLTASPVAGRLEARLSFTKRNAPAKTDSNITLNNINYLLSLYLIQAL
jgi:hypothetical protein